MRDKKVEELINVSLKALRDFEARQERKDFGDWEGRFLREMGRLIDEKWQVRPELLKTFRGRHLFVADRPSVPLKGFYHPSWLFYEMRSFLNIFLGGQRGGIREALDAYDVMVEEEFLALLRKYPTPDIGRPLKIKHDGFVFTNRYIRHIYLLGMFQRHLAHKLAEKTVMMDIGSSYGIFSSLIKQEYPKTKHVLVDLSGQLILAHYYLMKLFPQAKIAGFHEVAAAGRIDKDWISPYDFVLIPTSMFGLLSSGAVDCVTNFISLSEMSRHWFFTYVQSPVFAGAPFLFTVNRYDSHPTYANDLTVLDYPLDQYEKILMRTCPFLQNYYVQKGIFGYKRIPYPSQFFQFMGKRKVLSGCSMQENNNP